MRSTSWMKLPQPNLYFIISVILIAGAYLIYQLAGIPNWVLGIDEFAYARHLYEYTYHLPYRDFQPFKPVLGLYILSLPMFVTKGILQPLFYIKQEIAVINAACIMLAGIIAAKLFDTRAVMLALLAVLVNGFFIYNSTELRVDMLSGWLCLFALLAFLANRHQLAGALLGIGFLVSQKVIWYVVSINAAMIFAWLWSHNVSDFKKLLKLNVYAALPVLIYIAIWTYFSSLQAVLDNVFLYAYHQGTSQSFSFNVSFSHFQKMSTNTMVLFSLLPFAVIPLILSKRRSLISIAIITLFMTVQMGRYRELFTYNYDFILPILFVVYASAITQLIEYVQYQASPLCRSNTLAVIAFMLFFALLYIVHYFNLHAIAYLIAFMPLLVTLLYTESMNHKRKLTFTTVALLYIVLAIIYPFYQIIYLRNMYQGSYQRSILITLDQLLADSGDYVAGVPYLYYKDQPVSGLKNLVAPQIDYLWKPKTTNPSILRETFYLAPVTSEQVLAEFHDKNIKVIVDNKLMLRLPREIKAYLRKNYTQYYGSIYIYAPTISHEQNAFDLKFTGKYTVNAGKSKSVVINGVNASNGSVIKLAKGKNTIATDADVRLILSPGIYPEPLDSPAMDMFDAMLK